MAIHDFQKVSSLIDGLLDLKDTMVTMKIARRRDGDCGRIHVEDEEYDV